MRKYSFSFLLVCLAAANALAGWPPWGKTATLLRSGRVWTGRSFVSVGANPFTVPQVQTPLTATMHSALTYSVRLSANSSLQRNLLTAPSVTPLEGNIQHFLFTVSAPGKATAPAGSGFVFAQNLADGSLRLWGVTTAEIARQTGPDMLLTFHLPQGRSASFPGHLVAQGSASGSNAALIEVPQDIARVALPIVPSSQRGSSAPQEALAYGFHSDGTLYKIGLAPFAQTSERGLARAAQNATALTLQGGLVVDANGQALGLYNTSYNAAEKVGEWLPPHQRKFFKDGLNEVSEFIPLKHVEYLLREYETPHSAARVILFNGRIIGKIELDESIMQIRVWYDNATPATLDKNPFWSLHDLDQFIPYKEHATRIYIDIAGANGKHKYTYDIDLKKGHTLRIDGAL